MFRADTNGDRHAAASLLLIALGVFWIALHDPTRKDGPTAAITDEQGWFSPEDRFAPWDGALESPAGEPLKAFRKVHPCSKTLPSLWDFNLPARRS